MKFAIKIIEKIANDIEINNDFGILKFTPFLLISRYATSTIAKSIKEKIKPIDFKLLFI